tara:strand:+ start:947 stop:1468 length:522 start_codon:yes stop_codon:yes gene_type:complete
MATLYELSADLHWLQNADDLTEDEMSAGLAAVTGAFDAKAESIGRFILDLEGDAKKIKDEEARLAKRRKTIENKAGWLRGYLRNEMSASRIDRVEGVGLTLTRTPNPPTFKVTDETLVPAEHWNVVIKTTLDQVPEELIASISDKKLAAAALKKTGEVPEGTELHRGERLTIR